MHNERVMRYRMKKIKKELDKHFDKRNEYILDKIFQGNIIILGPENIIKRLKEVNNLKICEMRFEDKLTGYVFKDAKEFHTLYIAEKNEDLRKFLTYVSGRQDISMETIAGFSIFNDKDIGKYGILSYDLKDEEFNRQNVKNVIEYVLPKVDTMFQSAVNNSIQEFADNVMLSELMNVSLKNNRRRAK